VTGTRMSQFTTEQRRRIRWTTILLAATAIGIYVAFIASSVMKAPH
jgi:hypothetical protein